MKTLNILILALVIGATVALFFLLGPEEKHSLFYVNLLLTILLEGTLITSLFAVESRYNLQNIATSGTVFSGAGVVVLWMVVYNMLLYPRVEVKWYYAGLILIVVVYALITIFTKQGGAVQQEVNAAVKNAVTARSMVSLDARMLRPALEDALRTRECDAALRRETVTGLQLFIDKVTMLPALDLQRNELLGTTVNQEIEQIQGKIAEAQMTATKEEMEKILVLIKNQLSSVIAKVEILKK